MPEGRRRGEEEGLRAACVASSLPTRPPVRGLPHTLSEDLTTSRRTSPYSLVHTRAVAPGNVLPQGHGAAEWMAEAGLTPDPALSGESAPNAATRHAQAQRPLPPSEPSESKLASLHLTCPTPGCTSTPKVVEGGVLLAGLPRRGSDLQGRWP